MTGRKQQKEAWDQLPEKLTFIRCFLAKEPCGCRPSLSQERTEGRSIRNVPRGSQKFGERVSGQSAGRGHGHGEDTGVHWENVAAGAVSFPPVSSSPAAGQVLAVMP